MTILQLKYAITIANSGSFREAVSQYKIIEDRFIDKDKNKCHFSVSMQHYVFAVHAFSNVVKKFNSEKYVYAVRETQTDKVLDDVRDLKSEVGIISYSDKNLKVLKKILRNNM